jgi:hypothetical protein
MGTTAHYVVVDGSISPFAEIEVSGPRDAELQVTALPLGSDRPRLDLAVTAVGSPETGLLLRARVRERHGLPVHLSALLWEGPTAEPSKESCRSGRLDAEAIERAFGANAIAGHGELISRPITIAGDFGGAGALVFKVIGTDATGQRVVGWAQLHRDSNSPEP